VEVHPVFSPGASQEGSEGATPTALGGGLGTGQGVRDPPSAPWGTPPFFHIDSSPGPTRKVPLHREGVPSLPRSLPTAGLPPRGGDKPEGGRHCSCSPQEGSVDPTTRAGRGASPPLATGPVRRPGPPVPWQTSPLPRVRPALGEGKGGGNARRQDHRSPPSGWLPAGGLRQLFYSVAASGTSHSPCGVLGTFRSLYLCPIGLMPCTDAFPEIHQGASGYRIK
jgi:hypothetical protein